MFHVEPPNLRTLDQLEIANHTFERILLEHRGELWECQFAVDRVKRQGWLEPAENLADLTEPEMFAYLWAQSLGMPPARS